MNKSKFLVFVLIFILLSISFFVSAQEENVDNVNSSDLIISPAPNPFPTVSAGLLPTSPWYFLDKLVDKIRSIILITSKNKAEHALRVAAERFEELKVLAETEGDKSEALKEAEKNYENEINKANDLVDSLQVKNKNASELVLIVFCF